MNKPFLRPLIDDARAFYEFGWLMGTSGNLSRRIDDNTFVITASGRDKGRLTSADFLTLDLTGTVTQKNAKSDTPSAETSIHQVVYETLPDVGAVYHVHDPYAALCSRRDEDELRTTFNGWEMIKGLGIWDRDQASVALIDNFRDVTMIAHELRGMITDLEVPGINILNHGVYAWGATPEEAKRHIESFAYLFKVSWESGSR